MISALFQIDSLYEKNLVITAGVGSGGFLLGILLTIIAGAVHKHRFYCPPASIYSACSSATMSVLIKFAQNNLSNGLIVKICQRCTNYTTYEPEVVRYCYTTSGLSLITKECEKQGKEKVGFRMP